MVGMHYAKNQLTKSSQLIKVQPNMPVNYISKIYIVCIASEKPKGKWAILRFCMDFLGLCKHLNSGLLGPDRPVLIFYSFGGNP